MRARDSYIKRRFSLALGVSTATHLVVYLVLSQTLNLSVKPGKPTSQPATSSRSVPILSEAEVKRLLAKTHTIAPQEVKKTPEKEKPKRPDMPDGQVVEIPPPQREEVPPEARFLAEYNSKVDRQQVSALNQSPTPRMQKSDRKIISAGNDAEGSADAPRKPPKEKPKPKKDPHKGDAKHAAAKKSPDAPKTRKVTKVNHPDQKPLPKGDGSFPVAEEKVAGQQATPAGGGKVGGPADPTDYRSLLPTLGPVEQLAKDGSINHIEDVDKGEKTFLNAREYKYAWFFNRVTRGVRQEWHAVEAHRRNDPYGRVFGVRDRVTVVEVVLSSDGHLDDITLVKDSGVAFLDESAIQAFQEAAPFPNPPPGLKDENGQIRFRFSFYLEIGARGFRLFRSR